MTVVLRKKSKFPDVSVTDKLLWGERNPCQSSQVPGSQSKQVKPAADRWLWPAPVPTGHIPVLLCRLQLLLFLHSPTTLGLFLQNKLMLIRSPTWHRQSLRMNKGMLKTSAT